MVNRIAATACGPALKPKELGTQRGEIQQLNPVGIHRCDNFEVDRALDQVGGHILDAVLLETFGGPLSAVPIAHNRLAGAYAYFDTEADLDVILEIIERPRRRREPEAVWPEESA